VDAGDTVALDVLPVGARTRAAEHLDCGVRSGSISLSGRPEGRLGVVVVNMIKPGGAMGLVAGNKDGNEYPEIVKTMGIAVSASTFPPHSGS
jgi:hypothetical protein